MKQKVRRTEDRFCNEHPMELEAKLRRPLRLLAANTIITEQDIGGTNKDR